MTRAELLAILRADLEELGGDVAEKARDEVRYVAELASDIMLTDGTVGTGDLAVLKAVAANLALVQGIEVRDKVIATLLRVGGTVIGGVLG
jgi:hypothetical protein